MPKIYYCLKCSKAKYVHSRWCSDQTRRTFYYNSKGASCTPEDPDAHITIYEPHKLVDLHTKPYCRWERDYSRLKRVYIRLYKPANWKPVGWYCERCGNFIKTK